MALKKIAFSCVLLLVFSFGVNADELTGRQIMDKSSEIHDLPREYEDLKMNLFDSDKIFEKRELRRFSLEGSDGLFKYLTVFDGPAGVEGVALLSWQNKGRSDDQWTYLPAVSKKLKRTAGSSKRKPFLGTDFTYEDMTSDDRDDFLYERMDDTRVDEEDVYTVKAIPFAEDVKKETGYSWRVFYISKKTWFVTKVDFYNRRERHEKTQYNYDPVVVINKSMRPMRTLMVNHKDKTSTEMLVQQRKIDPESVKEQMFEHRWIKSGRYMR
ncbi:outer membrane lipoprotein-sorting protein [Oceanospirillum sp. HFRX-1_2]